MILYRAAWVVPIARPPIRGGWVAVDRGRIVAVGGPTDEPPGDSGAQSASVSAPGAPPPGALRSLRDSAWFDGANVAILPGLVNAHTHLELSWMRGRVPPGSTMPAWAGRLIELRGAEEADPPASIVEAIREARACGTSLVGEITNTLATFDPLADSPLSACVFYELIGFGPGNSAAIVAEAQQRLADLMPVEWLRPSIVPHAPYSVSPDLFAAIAAASRERVVSVHLAESCEELEFLREGTGAWRVLLERLGAWNAQWTPPDCGPVAYLERFGLVNERLLAVHAVQLADEELQRLARAGATVVACPRSNRWTGAGAAPIERFSAAGVRVAIGTDSLASADDLNVFSELQAARAAAPSIRAARLLDSATRSGAEALGFGEDLGTIEPGKRAELIAVRVPAGVQDVEEYLLSGIQPAAIQWLDPG